MQTTSNKNNTNIIEFKALVSELLGLDPAVLASLSGERNPANGVVCAGLNVFMRRTLARALETVRAKDAFIRLYTEASAKTRGWGDARTANLHALLTWAWAREPRRVRGSSPALLSAADTKLVEMPRRRDADQRMSSGRDYVTAATALFACDMDVLRDAPLSSSRYPVSICGLIRDLLGVAPAVLLRPYYGKQLQADVAFARDPEGQAAAGLSALLMTVLHTCGKMNDRNTDRVRLMDENDARLASRPDARSANIATILAAALVADDRHKIRFEPPRPRSSEQTALLRAAAKYVYSDYSHEAGEALNLLCDGVTFFGAHIGFTIAEKLLHDVAREVDPHFVKPPILVALQEALSMNDKEEAYAFLYDAVERAPERGAEDELRLSRVTRCSIIRAAQVL